MFLHSLRPRLRLPAALAVAGVLAGCDSLDRLMEVQNPGQIGEVALHDEQLIPAMATTAVSEFQRMFSDLAFVGAILTDEAVNGHNFTQFRDFDLRIVESTNSILLTEVYSPVQRARASADDQAARIREVLGGAAERNLSLARVLAYGGYSHVVLGEYFCEAPVRPDQAALTSMEILARAVGLFEEAIQVGTAFRAATPAQAVRADSLINLARVGAARAHLWMGNHAQAAQFASQVPENFAFWVSYGSATAEPNNRMFEATTGASRYLGVAPAFRGLNDPRVRHAANPVRGHNTVTDLWTPFQPPSFSEWTPGAPVPFERGTNIRLASGLEARYILAEAQGLNATSLAFINARRAVGNQPALTAPSEAEFRAQIREQRRRDFFLDGHRLGDLRRYIRQYSVDDFPRGPHPNAEWGNYGDATCFIPHNNERIGNPGYRP